MSKVGSLDDILRRIINALITTYFYGNSKNVENATNSIACSDILFRDVSLNLFWTHSD